MLPSRERMHEQTDRPDKGNVKVLFLPKKYDIFQKDKSYVLLYWLLVQFKSLNVPSNQVIILFLYFKNFY